MTGSTGWAASALAAMALAGCGGGASQPELPELLTTFCQWAAEVGCVRRSACDPHAPLGPEECVAAGVADCRPKVATLARAVQAGRLGFDSSAAEACRQEMSLAGCGTYSTACSRMFSPRTEPGGACDPEVTVAAAGLWLEVAQCQRGTCPEACGASCPPLVQLGEPCDAAVCAEGAYCGYDTAVCTARPSRGEPCLGRRATCTAGLFCAGPTGVLCVSATDASCTCQPLLPPGAACGADFELFSPSACDGGICWDGTCHPFDGAPGSHCLSPDDCRSGLECRFSSSGYPPWFCTAPGVVGEACSSASDCGRGLTCHADGRCGEPLGDGAPCTPSAPEDYGRTDCAPGLGCAEGACAPRPTEVGAPCSTSSPCLGSGLVCGWTCQPEPVTTCASAQDCPHDQACDQGLCVHGGRGGAYCRWGWSIACASGSCAEDLVHGCVCLDLAACR